MAEKSINIQVATLETRVKNLEDANVGIMQTLSDVVKELGLKVSVTTVKWFFGVIITVFLATAGFVIDTQRDTNIRLDKIYEKTNATQQDVSLIKGELKGAQYIRE